MERPSYADLSPCGGTATVAVGIYHREAKGLEPPRVGPCGGGRTPQVARPKTVLEQNGIARFVATRNARDLPMRFGRSDMAKSMMTFTRQG